MPAAFPGALKRSAGDFRVEELPAYAPSGRGDHVLFEVEKRDLATPDLVRAVARALGVAARDVGCAGAKDARAVTRQWLSVEHVEPERVRALELPGVRVLGAERHASKLRRGHLRGNRFRVVLRDSAPERLGELRAALERASLAGAPNAFGPQRFGNRGDAWQVGAELLRGDAAAAVRLIAGAPGPLDHGAVLAARERFEAGEWSAAAAAWPRGYGLCARLCGALARERGRADRALRALSRAELGFYASAWQARAFDRVLDLRRARLDELVQGDLAWEHASGRLVDAAEPTPELGERVRAHELSPTGPLPGPRMRRASGRAAALEDGVLDEECAALGEPPGSLAFPRAVRGTLAGQPGGRRPLRVAVRAARAELVEDDPRAVALEFELPPGAYATVLLRELCGDGLVDESRTAPAES